jgi:sugar lactone lactonase YvrE
MSYRRFVARRPLSLGLLAACGSGTDSADTMNGTPAAAMDTAPAALPHVIVAERGGFIPEGVEYDHTTGRFLTGSLAEGTIFEIALDGAVIPFVTDPDLVASVGIEVDEDRGRLLAANSDRSVFDGSSAGIAMLGVYDLSTGARIAMVDLGAAITDPPADLAHFANDVAVGPDGTAYVTDTRAGVIYAVSPDYEASVLHRSDEPNPGFNGIEVHPDGYLLVAGGSTLRKISLENPSVAAVVALPEEVAGQDGIVWIEANRLAVVSNSQNRVVILTSADDWATARIEASGSFALQGTTAAVANGEVYVVHPHFADADPPSITHVMFD